MAGIPQMRVNTSERSAIPKISLNERFTIIKNVAPTNNNSNNNIRRGRSQNAARRAQPVINKGSFKNRQLLNQLETKVRAALKIKNVSYE